MEIGGLVLTLVVLEADIGFVFLLHPARAFKLRCTPTPLFPAKTPYIGG